MAKSSIACKAKKQTGKQRKSRSNKQGRKLGQAATLPGKLWTEWLKHCLANARSWLYALLLICHLLCLRVSEGLALSASDFDFKSCSVLIKPLKRQPALRKPLLAEMKSILLQLKQNGVSKRRSEFRGSQGKITFRDAWTWPRSGALFPSERPDAKSDIRNKNTVAKTISRLRGSFTLATEGVVRSHSARHSMINALRMNGVPDDISMYYARISDKKVFSKYGQVTSLQASSLLKAQKSFRGAAAAQYQSLLPKRKSTRKTNRK
ncbi:unnamed protein product [Symbiodinium sp. CCMP2592]|nr:unnamed protein product [Symbiodinium sp. CCMP2592]